MSNLREGGGPLDQRVLRVGRTTHSAACMASRSWRPAAVRRYFCRLLVGLSAGSHDLVPELGAVAPAGIRHDPAYRLPGKAITQISTWCRLGAFPGLSIAATGVPLPVPAPSASGTSGRLKVVVTQFSETSIIGSATSWSRHSWRMRRMPLPICSTAKRHQASGRSRR